MPNVTQLIVAKPGLEHNAYQPQTLKLRIMPLHIKGPVHQDPIFRACRQLLDRTEAGSKAVLDKEPCWSVCLDARPASYSRGRETTPVGSKLPRQQQKETVLQQRGTLPCSWLPLPTAPSLPRTNCQNSTLLMRNYNKSNFFPIFACNEKNSTMTYTISNKAYFGSQYRTN